MIRLLQGNLHRSRVANDLLRQLAHEKKADLLLLSEQYRDRQQPSWYSDLLGTAAIWVRDPRRIRVSSHGRGSGFVWIGCEGVTYFSCYFTPNQTIQSFQDGLDGLEDEILRRAGPVVVAGDFNARALEWGMPHSDSRGRMILDMAARTGLLVLNTGGVSTFRRPGYTETIPDISLASEALAPVVQNWRVLEDYTGSDHQYITFDVHDGDSRQVGASRVSGSGWNVGRMDAGRFLEVLNGAAAEPVGPVAGGRASAEALVASAMTRIGEACEASMPRRAPRHGRRPVYWWTAEIAELRRQCHRLRRRAQRATDDDEVRERSAWYKAARRELRRTINRSKARCLRELAEDINRDPWGLGYKLVTKKLGAREPPAVMDAAVMEEIVNALFPSHPGRAERHWGDVGDFPLFSMEELERAILSMKNGKAPGPDGIPSEALKVAFEGAPDMLLSMYNACLSAGVFCSCWKVARLVLISKDGASANAEVVLPSAYRPLCMLNTAGKLFERLIKSRLAMAIRDAGDLSPRQYGFRAGRSTSDALAEVTEAVRRAEAHNRHSRRVVLLVTLDVKNAFNSVRWADMLEALEYSFQVPQYLLRILDDYLRDRALLYDTREGQRRREVSSGAAQGSILGPDLWNLTYDGLLRMEMPEETCLVAYADDVAALVAARTVDQAQLKLNQVMRRVATWMAAHGLSLALNKTEVVILTKKRIPRVVPVRIGEEIVESRPAIRYLGVMVDSRLSFLEQINRAAEKAVKAVAGLSRLMANVGGPSSGKRRLLMGAVHSVLLYGAEVWADALNKEAYRLRLARVQRRGALRVASSYRTVSEPAVLVIASTIPIGLLARERRSIYLRRTEANREAVAQEERARTVQAWQTSWAAESRGRWTARLIQDVGPWLGRSHGETDYYLTQFLSGHGYFRSYLRKMGKADSEECLYCSGARDDAEHTFFACGRWEVRRQSLAAEVGQLSPETIVDAMLRDEGCWNRVAHYVQGVLRAKKPDLDRLRATS